jgi:hypothetical protein
LKGEYNMKDIIRKVPLLRSIAKVVYLTYIASYRPFVGSAHYWKQRYRSGANSGAGSCGKYAEFKACVLNSFVREKQIESIIEYGCGDGNQLKLSNYPSYIGFDVSPEALSQCNNIFCGDEDKTFKLMESYDNETAHMTLSLDVIYHLVEDDVFLTYMEQLFDTSTNFVVIYSSNTDEQERFQAAHVKHRKFSTWIEQNRPGWKLIQRIPNRYPYNAKKQEGSFADFYIYEKS